MNISIARKIGFVISVGVGFVLGAVFTTIQMAKAGQIIPVGVLISALMSSGISGVLGFIVSMKDLSENIARKLSINPARQKFAYNLVQGLVGDIVFTPVLCTFFIIKNIGIHNPMFIKILLSSLGIDLIIALPLSMLFVPLFKKIASKIFHISSSSIN